MHNEVHILGELEMTTNLDSMILLLITPDDRGMSHDFPFLSFDLRAIRLTEQRQADHDTVKPHGQMTPAGACA
jgi:hypothetical protein